MIRNLSIASAHIRRRCGAAALLASWCASIAWPSPAAAAAPTLVPFEGALLGPGGTPAADGAYKLRFAIYGASSGGNAAWDEGPSEVQVQGGRFAVVLGASKTIDAAAWAALPQQWLGVQVGDEPELPRVRVGAAAFALLAGQAQGLACTGCVPVAALLFDGDVDLGQHALKAAAATFTGDVIAKTITGQSVSAQAVTAQTVTAQAFVGDGSKLTGIAGPSGSCAKAGEVVKGIAADGTLLCVAAAGSLPVDGLGVVSNGSLTNVFFDVLAAPDKNVALPDNTGAAATSTITVPDLGTARDLQVTVHVQSSDLAGVSLVLLPADDKAKGWVLCDPCGEIDGKELKKTWSVKVPPQSGDIAKWIDANPKGTWVLKALDTSFCIVQKPGNAALCNLDLKTDGRIVDWSVAIETLAGKKVHLKGDLVIDGTIVGGNVVPKGAVMMFDLAACPPGWTELTTARGRYLVGMPAAGKLGLTVGTALSDGENRPVGQHSHGVKDPGHSHSKQNSRYSSSSSSYNNNPPAQGYSSSGSSSTAAATTGISVDVAGTVAGTNAPYLQLLTCRKD